MFTLQYKPCYSILKKSCKPREKKIRKTKLTNPLNDFGLKILNAIEDENPLISPLSLQISLQILLLGLSSEDELRPKLVDILCHKPGPGSEELDENEENEEISTFGELDFGSEIERFLGQLAEEAGEEDVLLSNLLLPSLLLSNSSFNKLQESYIRDLLKVHATSLNVFNNKDKNFIIHNYLNQWCKSETNGLIESFVDNNDVFNREELSLALFNLAHFDSSWLIPFDSSEVFVDFFYNKGIKSKRASKVEYTFFNYEIIEFTCIRLKEFEDDFHIEAVSLPFKDSRFNMLILLPSKLNGVCELQKKLTNTMLDDINDSLRPERIHLKVPKFILEFKKNIRELLVKKLSLDELSEKRTFEGISKKPITLDAILHKARVKAADEGTGSGRGMDLRSLLPNRIPSMNVSHPFLFMIRHEISNTPLFMGRVDRLAN